MTNETNKRRRLPEAVCVVTATGVMIVLAVVLCPPTHAAPKLEVAPKPEAAKKAPANQFPSYALDVGNTRLAYTVTLNGFPIDDSPGDANGHFSSTRVGEYIADGDNIVSVHLSAPDPKFFSSFGVTVRTTGNPQLFDYGWDASVPHPHPPLPVQHEGHFTTHLPHGPWAWQTAPKITLDAPTKEAINAHIKRLFDALNTKNVDKATALFLLPAQQGRIARNSPASEAEAGLRAEWVKTFADPHWKMKLINYEKLVYTLIGDRHVVHVLGPGETYVLTDVPGNAAFDINLSLINGKWTQVL